MSTDDELTLNKNDMASALYPIFEDSSVYQQPDLVESSVKEIYSSHADQWDDEAKELLATTYDQYKKASNISVGVDWLSAFPAPEELKDESIPKETKLELVDQWQKDAEEHFSTSGGADWVLNSLESRKAIKMAADGIKRNVAGEGVSRGKDLAARMGQAAGTYMADLFGADETSDSIKEYFTENPEYDDSFGSKEIEAIGQAGGQFGLPVGLAVGTVGAVTALGGAKAAAVGTAVFVAAQSILGFVGGYKEAYDTVYEATGSENQATNTAMQSGFSTAGMEVVVNSLVANKLLSPYVKALSPTRKSRLAAAAVAAAEKGSLGAASGGVTEGFQDLSTQLLTGAITEEDVSWSQVGESTYLGLISDGTISGGGAGGATLIRHRSSVAADAAQSATTLEQEAAKPQREQTATEEGLERKKQQPLSTEAEQALATTLQDYADGNSDTDLTLDGIKLNSIPQDLLDILNLEATSSGEGTVVKRVPVVRGESGVLSAASKALSKTLGTEAVQQVASTAVDTQVDPVTTPPTDPVQGTPELSQRQLDTAQRNLTPEPDLSPAPIETTLDAELPGMIQEMEARLAEIPTINQLQNNLVQARRRHEATKELVANSKHMPNPKIRKLIAEAAVGLHNAETEMNRETNSAHYTYAREVLKDEIVYARRHLSRMDESGNNKVTNSEHTSIPYVRVAPYKVSQARSKSTKTGAEYTGIIDPGLRATVNSWAAGFDLKALGFPKLYVGTFFDAQNGAFNNAGKDVQAMMESAKPKLETSEAVAIVGDKKAAILLKSPLFNPKTVKEASHEMGHIVFDTLWNKKATEDTKAQVYEDYQNAKLDALKHKKAADVAKALGVRDDMYASDTRTFDQLTLDEQKYLIDNEIGFSEWFANKVSAYIVDPTLVPTNPAQRLYKILADAFKRIYSMVSAQFREQSPTLKQWLDEQFSIERARNTFPETPKVTRPLNRPAGQREMSVSKRLRLADNTRRVKEGLKHNYYTPLSPKATLRDVQNRVAEDRIDFNINEVLDEKNGMPADIRSPYAVAVHDTLQKMVAKETNPDKKAFLEDKYISFVNNVAEIALKYGRFNQALSLLPRMSKSSLFRSTKNQVEKAFERAKKELPANYDKIIKEVVDDIQPKMKGKDLHLLQEVNRQLLNRLDAELDIPTEGALRYFWYGNFLSGFDTQMVNVGASGMDLLGRTMASMIASPRDIPTIISGTLAGFNKAITTGEANLRGIATRNARSNKYGIDNAAVAPLVKWENRALRAPMNAMIKLLEKFPFRALRAQDAFMSTIASEQQAYLITARALRKHIKDNDLEVTREQFAQTMTDMLFDGPETIAKLREQAIAEAKEVYGDRDISDNALENSVTLRVFELVDQMRDPELVKEASRYGDMITYTQKPQGTFGVIAELMNKANRDLIITRYTVLPFVDVVANVLSRSVDYSPIGGLRAWYGGHLSSVYGRDKTTFSNLERRQRAAASFMGTASWGLLMTAASQALQASEESGEPPWFEWNGYGPKAGSRARDQWLSAGNKPWSLRIGDTILSYNEMPGAPFMALGGAIMDHMRYNQEWDEMDLAARVLLLSKDTSASITNMGFLSSIKNIGDIMAGKRDILSPLSTSVQGLVPGQGALRYINNIMDPTKVDYRDVKALFMANLPYAKSFVRPELNVFGEKLHRPGRFTSSLVPDPTIKWMTDRNLTVAGYGGTEVGTGRSLDEKSFYAAIKADREKHLGRYAANILTEEEKFAIQETSGPRIKKRIQALMDKGWAPESYQYVIDKIVTQERNRAKQEILAGQYRARNN